MSNITSKSVDLVLLFTITAILTIAVPTMVQPEKTAASAATEQEVSDSAVQFGPAGAFEQMQAGGVTVRSRWGY
ncbi:MAG: hypothetical protein KME06_00300 [Kastovskya adunca ATA6-11-RM4]|jgi:hypothetical protein|nr:hypothetical protein [Kastovskya adunca ATA6-11-RM4]